MLARASGSSRHFRTAVLRIRGKAAAQHLIGRLYEPSGVSELAPLADFGWRSLDALSVELRTEGDWQAA